MKVEKLVGVRVASVCNCGSCGRRVQSGSSAYVTASAPTGVPGGPWCESCAGGGRTPRQAWWAQCALRDETAVVGNWRGKPQQELLPLD